MFGGRNRMEVRVQGLEVCVLGEFILARVEKSFRPRLQGNLGRADCGDGTQKTVLISGL